MGGTFATIAMHTALSNWTDVINTKATNNTANITVLQGYTNSTVYTNDVRLTNSRPPDAHNQDYTTVTNAPWVTNGTTDHTSLTNVNGSTDVQHLTAAEKAIATNDLSAQVTATAGYTNEAHTSYGWGDHSVVGYLSAGTNLYNTITVANRSQLNTNISGFSQGVYTGSLTSISYTSIVSFVVGKTYEWGLTKANAYGTSTLSIASFSLVRTASGATSNYFTFAGTDTNLILKLDGDGSSKSDVSAVYLKQITGGVVHVAGGLDVGGAFTVAGKTVMYSGDAGTGTNLSDYNNDLAGLSTNLSDFNNDSGFTTNQGTITGMTISNGAATGVTTNGSVLVVTILTNATGANMYRYSAMTNANEQIEVLASGTNITAARVSTTITVTIPNGVKLFSMSLRWDGVNNGTTFNLDLGTNDMANASIVNRWGAVAQFYREDTGALQAGASVRLDTADFDRLIIQGLTAASITHCRFSF